MHNNLKRLLVLHPELFRDKKKFPARVRPSMVLLSHPGPYCQNPGMGVSAYKNRARLPPSGWIGVCLWGTF